MTIPTPGPAPGPLDHGQVVARAMAGLDELAARPLAEHVEVFEQVHAALGEALAAGSTGPA